MPSALPTFSDACSCGSTITTVVVAPGLASDVTGLNFRVLNGLLQFWNAETSDWVTYDPKGSGDAEHIEITDV
jgi:hypothetical protein